MYLRELTLRAAPGLPADVKISELRPGLVLLYGANASGKSTIGRTIGGILGLSNPPTNVDATSTWQLDDQAESTAKGTVVYGTRHWEPQDRWAGPPSDVASFWSLTLRGLLQTSDSSDAGIALEIQRQLSGGFDLHAVKNHFDYRHQPHRSRKTEAKQARSALRDHLRDQQDLAAQERDLEDLRLRCDEAAEAPPKLNAVNRAISLHENRASLDALEAELGGYPEEARDLPEGSADTAKTLEEDVLAVRDELKEVELGLEEAESMANDHAFPTEPPTRSWIEGMVERGESLVEDERGLREASEALHQATAALEEAAAAVWSNDNTSNPSLREIEALWSQLNATELSRRELEAWVAHLSRLTIPGDPVDAAAIQTARDLLIRWQAAPRSSDDQSAPEQRSPVGAGLAAAFGGILLVGAVALIVVGQLTPGLAVAIVAAGLLASAVTWWVTSRHRPTTPRVSEAETHRADYLRAGYEAPASWTHEDVGRLTTRLDSDLRRAREDERSRALRAEAEATRTHLTSEHQEKQSRLDATVESLGLDDELPALALAVQAQRLHTLATARVAHHEAQALADSMGRDVSRSRAALEEALAPFSGLGLPPSMDGRTIVRAARILLHRLTSLEQAQERIGERKRQKRRLEARLEEQIGRQTRHWQALGVDVGDFVGLAKLEDLHEAWLELDQQRADLELLVRQDETHLQAWPDILAATQGDLSLQKVDLNKLIEDTKELNAKLAKIEQAVKTATEGHTVAELTAAVERTRDALVADRDKQLELATGAALVGWLQERRDRDATPALLARARAWFLAFTNNRYELRVSREGEFTALDLRTQLLQRLSQLSDATRVQLVLAARLAFIEQAEGGGEPIPLFLDEVLSTSDPERFQGVASAILTLASRGRQVFYATASQDEVAQWRVVASEQEEEVLQVVALGDSSHEWGEPPAAPVRRETPLLENHDAVSYTRALNLPRPGLHTPAGSWPLALLLHDHLDAAYRAAQNSVVLVGQLEALLRNGVSAPLNESEVRIATVRTELLTATLEALREGRGKPVDWQVVKASGAVSDTFADRVLPLVQQYGQEPRLLLNQISYISGFYRSKLQQLRDHLLATGHLDDSEPLSTEAVLSRVQVSARGRIRDGELQLGEIEPLVRWFQELLNVEL